MYIYFQSTGRLERDGAFVATGYSGHGEGRNNPAMEAVHGIGPIPKGMYKIGVAFEHPRKGPYCMRLTPMGHDALGRSGFLIHGDSKTHDASQGCIILDRPTRMKLAARKDIELEVIA